MAILYLRKSFARLYIFGFRNFTDNTECCCSARSKSDKVKSCGDNGSVSLQADIFYITSLYIVLLLLQTRGNIMEGFTNGHFHICSD